MLVAVLFLIGLPVIVAATEAVSYHIRYRSNGSLLSAGREREYLLHVPSSYDGATPTPLVISIHGAGLWPAGQKEISRWNELADEHGLIVVYPSGETGGGPTIWNVNTGPGLAADVRFIADLIDTLRADYNIDPARIYANGLSNGGGMSFALSCTLSDRIAAVGTVGAAQTLPFDWCRDSTAVPVVAFHGTADPVTPYRGGPSWMSARGFPSVTEWTAHWARRNQCGEAALDSIVAPDVVRREYKDCAQSAAVVLYTILGGGHTWPGGGDLPEWILGRTSQSIDATREMWAFFSEHPLRRNRTAARVISDSAVRH